VPRPSKRGWPKASSVQQLDVDDVKLLLAPIKKSLIAAAVIGYTLSSVGAISAHADYYWHHHHYHHRYWRYDHHHHGYWSYY
jgi:hypothetical protein